MIDLISPDKKQYKANLHCHSVLSDGCRTPEELKNIEIVITHSDIVEDWFLNQREEER